MHRARCVAIIPCRGGSKRIPRKNVRAMLGEPLLVHIARAALACAEVDDVYFATDDDGIAAAAAIALGGRSDRVVRVPAALAGDDCGVLPVLLVAWERAVRDAAAEQREPPEVLCYLRATSPLVQSADVSKAVRALCAAPEADSIVAVAPLTGAHPSRFKQIDAANGMLVDAFPDAFPEGATPSRSEMLAAFGRSGAVSVLRPPTTIQSGSMWGARVLPLVCDDESSVDINTQHEWDIAEFLLARRRQRAEHGAAAVAPR